jgi:hypothetical protein
MKRLSILLASALLAATVAIAQDQPSSSAGAGQNSPAQSPSANPQVLRGCLSGSSGNYTLTDPNGMQYQVTGDDATLRSMVGREVEITGAENATTAQADDTRPTNAVEASDVRAVSDTCDRAAPQRAGPDNITPPPDRDSGVSPKGTPDTVAPPKPQLISMLQQESAPDAGTQQPKTNTQDQKANTGNNSRPSEMNAQTEPASPPSAQPQIGNSSANDTGMTENEANRDAQSARQSEINTNAQTGKDTGSGVDNQGVNNPSQTNPSAVPESRNAAKPGAAAPSSSTSPQAPDKQ